MKVSESMFAQVTREVGCPHCFCKAGEPCRTPKGRIRPIPHLSRVGFYNDHYDLETLRKQHGVRPMSLTDFMGRNG